MRAIDAAGRTADSAPFTIATPPFEAGLELDPYLQQLTPDRVAIVWQTYAPATTSLYFGPAGGPLAIVKRDPTLSRDHAVDGLGARARHSLQLPVGVGRPASARHAEFRTPPASRAAASASA